MGALGMGRKDDHGFGSSHPVDHADGADKTFQCGGVMRLHLEQNGMLASHMMALEDIVELLNGFLENPDGARVADRHADERAHVLAQFSCVDGGMITRDDAAVFEFLDALD